MTSLLSGLARLFGGGMPKSRRACRIDDIGTPAEAIYAIGDVHGCRDLLARLLDLVADDALRLSRAPRILLLGDMVDRGPDTAGVLDLLAAAPGRHAPGAILGNHERLMLDFIAAPHAAAGWLDLGGFETLRSYGLTLTRADLAAMSPRRARQCLAAHLPEAHLAWLDALPHGVALALNGRRYMLTHAGYDTTLPPLRQSEATLLWGQGAPDTTPDTTPDGRTTLHRVHGHRIVDRPDPAAAIIRIDTGAWKTGTLTCLRLCDGMAPSLLSVTAARAGGTQADKG